MQGAAFFCFRAWRGGAEKKKSGQGREKMLGAGRVTVKPWGIFGVGRGGAFLKIFGARAPRGSHFLQGRGGAGIPGIFQRVR